MNKRMYRYTNVELLDIIKNGTEEDQVNKARVEFDLRNLTLEERIRIESEYITFKELKEKRKNEPLTVEEWFSFFFLPFFTPKPRWRDDDYSKSELERFERYGLDTKLQQAKTVRKQGRLFWTIMIVIGISVLISLKA